MENLDLDFLAAFAEWLWDYDVLKICCQDV